MSGDPIKIPKRIGWGEGGGNLPGLGKILKSIGGEMASLGQGHIRVGNDDNEPEQLDASGDGYILIGDGSDLNSVEVTGDIGIDNAGVVTIGNGAITQNKLGSDANLAAVIAAGLGATEEAYHDDAEPTEVLAADAEDGRACLVMAIVTEGLTGDAEFSVQDSEEDTILEVPPLTEEGAVFTGAINLAATRSIVVAPTTGDSGAVRVFVIAMPTE